MTTNKTALKQESLDFAEWVVLTQKSWTETQVRHFLDRLGMEIQPPIVRRQGARFQKGDLVQIKKDKHTDPVTMGPYEMFNGKIGTVTETDGVDALVEFKGEGSPVRFQGALRPRGVGIFRYTPAFVVQGSPAVEIIYLAGGQATDEQKVVVDKYLARARPGEQRLGYYYSGYLFNARLNQSNQVYFQVFPQQRVEIDPASEASYMARSFNPQKGNVVYMGILGRRPNGWKDDLEAIRAEAPDEDHGGGVQNLDPDPLDVFSQELQEEEARLRKQLIRMAHANPNLRKHLLPMLKKAAWGGRHMATKTLPPSLKKALKEVGFGRSDVQVEGSATYVLRNNANDGERSFACAVDLATGRTNIIYGSWGGGSPFAKQMDVDDTPHPIPYNGAVILGTEGGGRPTYARILVHPDNLEKLLPGETPEISESEKSALRIISGIKSGYRREEFSRAGLGVYGAQNPVLQALVAKGLIRVTGTGITLTLEGKNAL